MLTFRDPNDVRLEFLLVCDVAADLELVAGRSTASTPRDSGHGPSHPSSGPPLPKRRPHHTGAQAEEATETETAPVHSLAIPESPSLGFT
jgi:hypothetical protein